MTASARLAQYIPLEIEPPPLLRFSFTCFCVFLLGNFSRFFEWKLQFLHVLLISSSLALLGAAMEGRALAVFDSGIGKCMAILTVLYAINVPFSSWRGDSFNIFAHEWLKTFAIFVIGGALIFNFRQCRTALHCIGFGVGVAGLLVLALGRAQGQEERVSMTQGTLGNSNAVASDMLLGLPCLWLVLKDPSSGKLKKLLAAGLMVNCVFELFRTGSRMGLLGFTLLCFLFFLRSSLAGKILMSCLGVLLVLGGLAVLPNSLKSRYATILSGSDSAAIREQSLTGGDASAVESAAARRQLLINSLKVSLTHPFIGIGIGQFGSYLAGVEHASGLHAGWQGTHNTYTQVSSEAGIPALIAYVCMIVFSITGVRALRKRAKNLRRPDNQFSGIIDVSFALTTGLIVFAVCIFFDYVAYNATLPLLAAISVAFMRCGNRELDRAEQAQLQERQSQVINLYAVRAARTLRPAVF